MKKTFIHLSDIHFSRRNDSYDLDQDLRHQFELDIKEVAGERDGLAGIFVTGDIAFSGKREEYEVAHSWLKRVCSEIGCDPSNVWTVPGNHDVNHQALAENPLHGLLRREIRDCTADQIDSVIARYVRSDSALRVLFEPLEEYNSFAKAFGCSMGSSVSDSGRLYWEDDIQMGEGVTLRIRGLNSALVSDSSDSNEKDETKLVIGELPVQLKREPGVYYITLAHHPPGWLRDEDKVRKYLDSRSILQLYGHTHELTVDERGDSLVVVAGAFHPSRPHYGWNPRYNFIELSGGLHDSGELQISILPRVWDFDQMDFVSGSVKGAKRKRGEGMALKHEPESSGAPFEPDSPPIHRDVMRMNHQLVYDFAELPFLKRQKILVELELISSEEQGLRDYELFQVVFERATARNLLQALAEKTAEGGRL